MLAALIGTLLLQPGYVLVFSDEFDRPGRPDPKKWSYEHGFVRNSELQWYQPENAYVKSGLLVIEARHEQRANPNFVRGSDSWKLNRRVAEYTSASVTTKGVKSWKYGTFVFRARFRPERGLWPAIWTTGDSHSWPECGELDLFEYYQETVLANACWANGIWDSSKTPLSHFIDRDPKWSEKFHVWREEWNYDRIRMYLDDELLNEIDLSKTLNKDGFNPMRQNHHWILNLAIGSTGGDPSKTVFPAKFEIDYVRIYQSPATQGGLNL